MTTISASQVKALRDKTGISMGDCKKALVEASGDEAKAIEILEHKYAGQMDLRADREVANGRIGGYADGTAGALIELRCETDFVANNADFKAAADAIAEVAAKTGVTDPEGLLETKVDGGKSVREIIAAAFSTLRENISLARAARIDSGVACYVHHNGRVGTVLAADGDGGEVAKQVCWHLAAQNTLDGLNREDVEPAEVAKARELMREQAAGKPDNIVEKIVAGKLDKWYSERVLPEQSFLPGDGKETVGDVARRAGINISGYLKFEVGAK